jgi:glutaminase
LGQFKGDVFMSPAFIGRNLFVWFCALAFAGTLSQARLSAADGAAASCSPVAPLAAEVTAAGDVAYEKFKNDTGGKNADYIPTLAKVNPKLFGVAIVSTNNQAYSTGDVRYSFSIQSIAKVFTLALALNELGPDLVFDKIGSEATGRPFNSLNAVVDMPTHTGNPMVNAGAIATVSLISGTADEKWKRILAFYSEAAGEKLTMLDEIYKSGAATNQGNRALAVLLVKYNRIYADPVESVDVYTKECSVGVNTKQLAMMGATIANNGVNPATGRRVIKAENIPYILAAMSTAGLYDSSGNWAWNVGLPAKSGVGGGIIAIAPGKGAIASFAPPLDEAGNSVKAQKVIAYVARRLNYNLFSPMSVGLGSEGTNGCGK